MENNITEKSCMNCVTKSLCFSKLSDEELRLVDANKVELKYKKGEIIAKQGSYVNQILYLQKGLVKIYKEVTDDNNLILTIFPHGSLIGLPSLYSDNKMQYSAAAVVDSVVCAMDKKMFENFIQNNGQFASAVIATMNRCMLYNFDKIISFTQKQMNGRIAEALLFLADSIFHSDKFNMELSRKDLAEFTGMSVMSVVRGIKDFKESGIIRDENSIIEILNREKLVKISVSG